MYLKSLTLKGFKSFADRTTMVFDPGLTVVVGPNGSGKSNVSDAILWVLGEQSPKMLRGNAMEDVIFAGSSARKAVSVAEVTLVLDNTDHTLPIDFSEVSITRRMFRSGESEYLINNAPSRLMDVQDILHDSGLGKDTHSIISQGKLDSVLSSRPEERRSLIEETADISKHRRRKERSERKLKAMDDNLARAKAVSREVQRQLRPLERQVDKARRAKELEGEVARLTQVLAVDDLRRLQQEHADIVARGKQADAAVSLAAYSQGRAAEELDRLRALLEEKGLFVGDLGEQRRRTQQILGHMDATMLLLEEKGKNMVSRLSDLRMTLSSLSTERSKHAATQERLAGELSDARVREGDLAAKEGEARKEDAAAKAARTQAEGELARLTAEQRDAQAASDRETLAYARLEEQLRASGVEDGMYQSRLEELDELVATASEQLAQAKAGRDELAGRLSGAQGQASDAKGRIAGCQKALEAARAAERDARGRLSDAQGSLDALRSAQRALESASPLLAELAQGAEAQVRLSDAFEAPPALEATLERLLGDDLDAIVVPDGAAELGLARQAGASQAQGRATLVRLDAASRAREDDGAPGTSLVSRLTVRPGFEALVSALLGDVRLVDDAAAALAAHEARGDLSYVGADGSLALPDGRLRLGVAPGAEDGALERKRRMRALEAGMGALEGALEQARASLSAAEADLSKARDESARATSEVARLTGELRASDAEAGRLSQQVASAQAERSKVGRRRATSQEKADEARREVEGHRAKAAEAAERVKALAGQIEAATKARDEAQRREQGLASTLADARLGLAMAKERRQGLERRVGDLGRRVAELDRRIAATEQTSRALEVVRLRVDPLHEALSALEGRARAWDERLRDRASLAEADSESLKRTIGEAKDKADEAQRRLDEARAAANDVRVETGRVEVQVDAAVSAIEATGADLEEALALPAPDDRDAAQARLEELKASLESLGPVNAVAMEEYERLRERADYLREQVDDLEHARVALRKISLAIDRKMRDRFLAAFDAVNANFTEIFGVLFPGGEAHLELTDPDNLSETGIEIVAQPRGKRLTKMTLMSGGERSLTALALLFAVYKARTVPFYVFDEVEAALDDSNLSKLLDAIERLKQTTQLIVISHQRRTMEQADVLYGVTMHADGVSHVVSQRLDRTTGKVVEA